MAKAHHNLIGRHVVPAAGSPAFIGRKRNCSVRRRTPWCRRAGRGTCNITRRELVISAAPLSLAVSNLLASNTAEASSRVTSHAEASAGPSALPLDVGDLVRSLPYGRAGPLGVSRLPVLEHTASAVFPECVGDKCILRAQIFYPRGGTRFAGIGPPYPLAILSPGFLVSAEVYQSYAQRLASWGYVCMLYDKRETVNDVINDDTSVKLVRELIDWASVDPVLVQLCDSNSVYLVGHSRGGKISALTAARDVRVKAVLLIDPVDNTQYAPLGPGYPSAAQALRDVRVKPGDAQVDLRLGPLPIAVVGAGVASDCVPRESNYDHFYSAAPGAAWKVVVRDAGHFQFVDKQTALQAAICAAGAIDAAAVRKASMAVMVTWGEVIFRRRLPVQTAAVPTSGGVGAEEGDEAGERPVAWPGTDLSGLPTGVVLQAASAWCAGALGDALADAASKAGPRTKTGGRARDTSVPVLESSFKGITMA